MKSIVPLGTFRLVLALTAALPFCTVPPAVGASALGQSLQVTVQPPLRLPPVEQRGPGRPRPNPNFREPEPLLRLPDGSYLTSINGVRRLVVFQPGREYVIRGRGLSGGTAAWILGNPAGGSVLDVLYESDTELRVRVSHVSGARSLWPRVEPSDRKPGVWLLIEADYGQRRFYVLLPESYYSCSASAPNCAPR